MSKNKAIMVYTDGACSNNPGGPGGWAATLNYDDRYDVLFDNLIPCRYKYINGESDRFHIYKIFVRVF